MPYTKRELKEMKEIAQRKRMVNKPIVEKTMTTNKTMEVLKFCGYIDLYKNDFNTQQENNIGNHLLSKVR
jgi:hypothetical protein